MWVSKVNSGLSRTAGLSVLLATRLTGNFLPFLAADFNGDGYFPVLAVLTDYLGDALEETFLDPIHHEPVRRKQA